MKKTIVFLTLLLVIVGCAPKDSTSTEDTENVPQVISGAKGDYSIITPFKYSPLRTRYAESFREVDAIEIGKRLQDISKEYFAPEKYYVSEGSIINEERYNSLLARRSDKNPYGLNAEKGKSPFTEKIRDPKKNEVVSEVVIPDPAFVHDIIEMNFYKDKGRETISGISLAVVFDRYQVVDPETGLMQRISDESLLTIASDVIGVQLEAYLRNIEEVADVPIMIAFYVQDSTDDVLEGNYLPGHYIAHGYFEKGSTNIQLKQTNEKWMMLNSSEASTELPQVHTNFASLRRKIETFSGDENIGVVGKGFVQEGQIQEIHIDVNTGSKTQLELYGITQFISSQVSTLDEHKVPVIVNIKLFKNTRAVIKYTAGSEPITTFIQ